MSGLLFDKFEVPEVARDYITYFLTDQEIRFVENIEKEVFDLSDIARLVPEGAEEFAASAYRRGILSLVDEQKRTYTLNNFYGRLDIFAISETEAYRSIPEEARRKMDDWYFDAYYEGLEPDPGVRPTPDQILLMEEVFEFIDRQERPVYLNYCDCRSLSGDCGLPTKTCITYKNGINTFAHRGLSEQIDKERAKEVVREADRAGLMHTVNPNGICNCCGDCCYLFRSQRKRDSGGFWPETKHIVSLDREACIACGKCTRRCHFGVFEKKGNEILVREEKCVGCGICATACPKQALKMKGR
ncbi:MAG: 4Fe-4S binding protein [Lachnospiraceae bacterium]|nr:4Fe-4S binding protein [Lachnospiraceae bacterium]